MFDAESGVEVGPESPTALLVAAGRVDDHRVNLDREAALFGGLSASGVPPLRLVDAVFASHWVPGLEVLVRNEQALGGIPDLRDRLVATGDPRIALAVLQGRAWTKHDRRRVLAGADLRPEWRELWTAVRRWLIDGRVRAALAAAVVCPFPDVLTHAVSEPGAGLTRAELLRALSSLRTHGGDDAVRRVLDSVQVDRHPDVRELVEASLAGADDDPLRAAVSEAEGTVGLVDELRDADTYSDARDSLIWRADLDGTALLAAHEGTPFGPHAAVVLVERPDCPAELLLALCRTHPRPEELLKSCATPPPATALLELPPRCVTAKVLEVLVERCVAGGLTGEDLLAHARPAKTVLALAHAVDSSAPAPLWEGFHAGLARLVRSGLGADVAAWRAVAELLNRFRGTVPDLVEKAARHATGNDDAPGPWPGAADVPGHTDTRRLDVRRRAFVALVDAADDRTMDVLAPLVDGRTAYDTTVHGRWRPARLADLIARGPGRELALTARHSRLPADAVAPLAALDDPEVNAGLVYQIHANGRLLLDIVQGVPQRPCPDGTRIPLSPTLRAELLPADGTFPKRQWLAPFVGSGDPELLAAALAVVQIRTRHLQLKMALGQWERAGRDTIGLPNWFSDPTKALISALRTHPDPRTALESLRAHVRDAESADSLAKRLRTTTARSLPQLLNEGYRWDWSVLEVAHARGRLGNDILPRLAELPGCPDTLCRPGRDAIPNRDGKPMSPATLRSLTRRTLRPHDDWVSDALAQGRFTVRELLQHGRPVAALPVARIWPDQDARTLLESLVHDHLDGNTEAWVIALRLLDDFTGTLPELLTTAEHAAS
ncbi:hypothetical protein [Embleya hyalina]|uniref:Uncharacterized protein n=1 Tax=Embleya hyalina TaxID=516124 RepID=A0A401Z1U8_9ACTN|nr:hypothetical protein [Embleya hyalina]GCE00837.1 hypothetical protein EHYA_08563 [Embleya hyalina]